MTSSLIYWEAVKLCMRNYEEDAVNAWKKVESEVEKRHACKHMWKVAAQALRRSLLAAITECLMEGTWKDELFTSARVFRGASSRRDSNGRTGQKNGSQEEVWRKNRVCEKTAQSLRASCPSRGPTWGLTTIPDFWPRREPSTYVVHRQICRQSTHT